MSIRRVLLSLPVALAAGSWGCGSATDVPGTEHASEPLATSESSSELAAAFVPAPTGCAMAHCDSRMSDQVKLVAPPASSTLAWKDTTAAGSNFALGCASNGTVVACSFGGNANPGPYLKVYSADGAVKWTSLDPVTGTDRLSATAFSSAPMIDAAGGVIAADRESLIRFDASGRTVWRTALDGNGLPISPVITSGGILVLGTNGGTLSAYDSRTGTRLSSLVLAATEDGQSGAYVTRNTPAISGQTVFLSTEFQLADGTADPLRHARLFAMQVPTQVGQPFVEQWSSPFGARSGASPTVTEGLVIFDGDRLAPCDATGPDCDADDPHFFALSVTTGAQRWTHAIPAPAVASAAVDPRGGVWVYSSGETVLRHLNSLDGTETPLDIGALSGHPDQPVASVVSVSTDEAGVPVLTFAQGGPGLVRRQYLTAVVLSSPARKRFSVLYGTGTSEWSAAQFPIVRNAGGKARIVVSRFSSGVVTVGVP